YAGLALTELYLGRTESASKHWELALAGLNTLTERGQLRTLGNYYFSNQQDYDKALETYERLVERYPVDNVAQNNLAVAAFYALDFDRAFEVGRVVADRYADRSAFAANLALYAMYASNFDEARSVADKVIELDPVNAYANFVIAQTQAMAEEWPAVESTYETMQAHDQFARSVAAEGLADLALYRGDTVKALQTLEKAIDAELALNALNTVALKHTMRADAYLLLGDNEQVLEATAAALEIEANDPAVLVPAALAFIELSQFEKAEEIITTLSDGFSKSRRAYGQALRANLASKQGDTEAAIEAANAAIELADLWLIRLVRANVLLKADRLTDAQADLLDCEARTGEGIAVFLNDRPSLRFIRQLEALRKTAGTT
ncbi:MAG: tetratricopeptide repeat protein, partial [Woeseiaceae bacterium]